MRRLIGWLHREPERFFLYVTAALMLLTWYGL